MSKAEITGQPRNARGPDEQLQYFVEQLRFQIYRGILPQLQRRVTELGLHFTEDEFLILAALETPSRVQQFLDTQIYYNNDHKYPGQPETAQSPRAVLRTGEAHCFEGAMFACAVNYLHGHSPRMMLLESTEDSDHNLIVYRDPQSQLYGCNAHSAYAHLDGRSAEFSTIRALVESYRPFYYSDYSLDPNDLTLVGYSEPFDMIERYGSAWIDSTAPLWDIYSTYIDDTIRFHDMDDASNKTHIYPMLNALKQGWIRRDERGKPFVSPADMPEHARGLWEAFWRAYDRSTIVPRGEASVITKEFFSALRVSPLDLQEYVRELEKYLGRGYRIEQILTRAG